MYNTRHRHELSSSLQNNGTLSVTINVCELHFLKKWFLMCFTVELLLVDTQITSGHPEKESLILRKVILHWCTCYPCELCSMSNFFCHECNFLFVKFLISLNLEHLFAYSSTSVEYPDHYASNFSHLFE